MRSLTLALLVALCVACTGGDERRAPSGGDSKQSATKDADMPESRYLVIELRWTVVIDRHPTPAPEDDPFVETVETASRFEDVLEVPDYSSRPAEEQPEILRREWKLAIPESTPATFELGVDGPAEYRLILFSRGWTTDKDGRVTPAVVMKSNWELDGSTGQGGGPNQVGLGKVFLAGRQADRVISRQTKQFAYYEFMEARYTQIAAIPPAGAIEGHADTAAGQADKEREWPIKVVKLP